MVVPSGGGLPSTKALPAKIWVGRCRAYTTDSPANQHRTAIKTSNTGKPGFPANVDAKLSPFLTNRRESLPAWDFNDTPRKDNNCFEFKETDYLRQQLLMARETINF